MRPPYRLLPALWAGLALLLVGASAAGQSVASAVRAPGKSAVASAHPLASEAGMEVLAKGGNAFDAAVAVSAALAVVEPKGSGLGGGGFYLLHRADGARDVFLDARETAPAAATRDMFLDQGGNAVRDRSRRSGLAAGIPGEPAAFEHLATQYGKLPLSVSLAPAIRIAREGFPLYPKLRSEIERVREAMLASPDAAQIFLVDGQVPPDGHLIRQPDLARTLELLARDGAQGFYTGAFAQKLVAGVRELGGIWSVEDLAGYRVIEREPLVTGYKGLRVITAPPPSSGGLWLANVFNMLSGYDLERMDPLTRKHVIVEAMRRAHRDRAEYVGDPAFVQIPVEMLTSPWYAAGQRASIRFDAATPSRSLPSTAVDFPRGTQTTHFAVLDAAGNRVSGSITLNGWFGTGLVARGTGVLLNNEMDDFVARRAAPNQWELVGGGANLVEPGKRPASSMTPTFVESDKGVAILGAPGGSFIPSMVLISTLAWMQGADATQIVATPRFHHQFSPDTVFSEDDAFSAEERAGMEKLGHAFRPWPMTIGNMQIIAWDYASGAVTAASDPRGAGVSIVR
jgi:gamma-glutamyltranspeptidase/glutathione hydrolase